MISLVSMMWATALFFALAGAVRGWRGEITAAAGVILGFFAILQFDNLLRGSLYLLLTNELTFLLQTVFYLGVVVTAYRSRMAFQPDNTARGKRSAFFGALAGFFNGYMIAGSIWYFLDVNRYPFAWLVSAPAEPSASFQSLGVMPVVLLGGGLAGNGALLALAVLVILAVVILVT
ncbi:MAG: hypothetical protein OXG78_07640 [Chloroflexi bacterium]|nr:hypothetical protein [Chloroflexota bacterium]